MSDKLLNIGPKSAAWLRQVGVRSVDDLKRLGAVGAFLKVKRAGFRPSLNLLYALAGAELGVHWTALSAEQKNAMVLEVNAAEDAQALRKRFITPARDVTASHRADHGESEAAVADPGLFDAADGEAGEVDGGDAGGADGGAND